MTWELTVVENAGEIPAEKVTDAIAVPAEPLLIDIKSQLMIEKPKTLVYTVGWRAYVWQNKETGQFKDISEEEYEEFKSTGRIKITKGSREDVKSDASSTGNEASDTQQPAEGDGSAG